MTPLSTQGPFIAAALLTALLTTGQNSCSSDADADDWTTQEGDCNDMDDTIYPNAPELCDSKDNDCDGQVDEGSCSDCVILTNFGHTYAFCPTSLVWQESEARCESTGYHLATINDADEDSWVQSTAVSIVGAGYGWWIGYNDINVEGNFEWVNGEQPGYTNWDGGEPNDSGGEDCTSVLHWDVYSYHWNDLPCSIAIPYVCESL